VTCQLESNESWEGLHTLEEISEYIESHIRVADTPSPATASIAAPRGFPLSNPHVQSSPSSRLCISKDTEWAKLLTGYGIAGPNQDPPVLSLAKSERHSTARVHNESLEEWFDIDSITFQAYTLAAHRSCFKMYLAPNYLQSIRRDQKIQIQGLATPLHKTKHIALGYGVYSRGVNFTTYMVFPHYPGVKARGQKDIVTHLDNKSLERLYNSAILPATQAACGTHITQHAPVSYQDAYSKAHVHAEIGRGGGSSTGIGLTSTIPEASLPRLWTDIKTRCSTLQGPHANQGCVFREPMLIVQAHDTKLDFARCRTQLETHRAFCETMDKMFYFYKPGYINKNNFWVDFAREIITQAHGCTALGKQQCLEHRLRKTLQQKGQQPNSVTKYPMAGLRDVGAITVRLHQKSQLYAGGIVDVKAYNVNKEQLAVPVKNHSPFSNCSLEGLGLTEGRLQE
jgi:hypothetical protein